VRSTIAAAAALIVALSAQVPGPRALPVQDVRIVFETANGALQLRAFASVLYTVDVRALKFSLRPYDAFYVDRYAQPQPIAVDVGQPVSSTPSGQQAANEYIIPIVVAAPPRPGMYELSADPSPDFARDANGRTLPSWRYPLVGIGAIAAWWPDERGGDPGLRDVRARFAARAVHTYGHIGLACPNWGTQTTPEIGVDLGTVTRETGRAAVLQTGATWGGGDHGFTFLAFDPLALQVTDAHVAPPPALNLTACDYVLRFADPWHVDIALTTAAPPGDLAAPVRIGMSRQDVVWRVGYPNAYGTVASFRAQERWDYDAPAPFAWSVTFAKDRVVQVHPPGSLPG